MQLDKGGYLERAAECRRHAWRLSKQASGMTVGAAREALLQAAFSWKLLAENLERLAAREIVNPRLGTGILSEGERDHPNPLSRGAR
jgi:hypothetical protein